jgi:hypothetical protein
VCLPPLAGSKFGIPCLANEKQDIFFPLLPYCDVDGATLGKPPSSGVSPCHAE